MLATSVPALNETFEKTQGWLHELSEQSGFVDENQAYSALRAVLHALRDRLPVEEAAHLASQLPMLVRGFYYEGWRPTLAPNKERTVDEFVAHVELSLRGNTQIQAPHAVEAVLRLLEHKLTAGQMDHLRQDLPKEIVEQFWPKD